MERAINGALAWQDIELSGWVINSLAVTFWALHKFSSFENGRIAVVNLRGDADTNGAIYGGLAGAVHVFDEIPARWVMALKKRDELEGTLEKLKRNK